VLPAQQNVTMPKIECRVTGIGACLFLQRCGGNSKVGGVRLGMGKVREVSRCRAVVCVCSVGRRG